MNAAAQKLCLKSPTMLTRRGDLLIAAQAAVKKDGYQFKKGFSRSKNAASTSSSPPKKRRKLNQELRTKRMLELHEDIKDYNNRILFKEKRCEAALAVKNYKLCDNLTEEMCKLKADLRTHEAELQSKQRRSDLYVAKKAQQKRVRETSDSESDSLSTTRSDSLNLTPSDESSNLSRSGSSQPPNFSLPFLSPTTQGIVPNTSTPQTSAVRSTSQYPVISLSSPFEASANEPSPCMSASDSQYFQIGLPAADLSNAQLLGGR